MVSWVWLLHDDSAPDVRCLAALLDTADDNPSAGILGPKVLGWHDRRLLLEAGVTINGSGRRITGVERREHDQGQHDGVRDVLLSRRGVCRDYAHVVAGLLRAVDVPARTVSVYAPGLAPMDFHAVVEAYLDGQWYVLDATGLAPRGSMVRIATGRDAADTAFMSTYGGAVTLRSMRVTATEGVAQETELDDALIQLA